MSNATTFDSPGSPAPPNGGRGRLDLQSWVLIGLGLVFVGGGAAVNYFGLTEPSPDQRRIINFMMCFGFAIILSEIGTRATVRYHGTVITGAGAAAIILYVLLTPTILCQFGIYCPPPPPTATTFELSGIANIPGNTTLDEKLLSVTTFPRNLDKRKSGHTIMWTETFAVELDSKGRPIRPSEILLNYPGYQTKPEQIPALADVGRSSDSRVIYKFQKPLTLPVDKVKP